MQTPIMYAQSSKQVDEYSRLKRAFIDKSENDKTGIPLVKAYLQKAKKENNYNEILVGYQYLVFFEENREQKLKYAEQSVRYALQSKNDGIISRAYLGKGIIYYFFFRKYQPALDEYLKAFEYSKQTEDPFLKNRIIYHMGVVKNYLGHYQDALDLFDETQDYFGKQILINKNPNIIFNNQKGYLNTLHQKAISYLALGELTLVDSLVKEANERTPTSSAFDLERAYFQKIKGILDYKKSNNRKSIEELNKALPYFEDDFSAASVSYFYMGKASQKLGKPALPYFLKIDSIFRKEGFILPEQREGYEFMIDHYRTKGETQKELFYTKELLKADEIFNNDFKYLSLHISKGYDTQVLLDRQKQLEKKRVFYYSLIGCGFLLIVMVLLLILQDKRKKYKSIKEKFAKLQLRLEQEKTQESNFSFSENSTNPSTLTLEEKRLLDKLHDFELGTKFLEKGLTIKELSYDFSTNTTYLSKIINTYKGKNFNQYLNELRVNYMTKKMFENHKYLTYTVEALSQECGMGSRQSFTRLFKEINGLSPREFIKLNIKRTS